MRNNFGRAGGKIILAGGKIILAGWKIILAGGKIILPGGKIILAGQVEKLEDFRYFPPQLRFGHPLGNFRMIYRE